MEVNLWQTSPKYELLNLFHIVEHIENGIYMALRGISMRTLVDKGDLSWVSVGPRPCPASLTAEMITISAHLRHIPRTPALICIIPSRGTSSLFGNVPRKRVSTPLSEVKFSLRFRHVNTSQRSFILNHVPI